MQALLLFRAAFYSSESLPAVDQHDLSSVCSRPKPGLGTLEEGWRVLTRASF